MQCSLVQRLGCVAKRLLMLFLLFLVFNACAHPYFVNRGRDATDIVKATVGVGAGGMARVGPVCVGILPLQLDGWGWNCDWVEEPSGESALGLLNYNWFVTVGENNLTGGKRGKMYRALGGWYSFRNNEWFRDQNTWASNLPFLAAPIAAEKLYTKKVKDYPRPLFHPYYTQAEVCVAWFGSLRIGLNPGELADFVLGWVGIDFFDDDGIGVVVEEEYPFGDDLEKYYR